VNVEALRWKGDALEVLDQRLLPEQVVYLTCRNAGEVADAIRDMAVRGAPAIGCAAAFGIALDPREASYDVLAGSRPTAVNLFWALERMRRARDKRAEAEAIFAEDVAVNRAIGANGAKMVPDKARILTYCNTGALATAGHGTALGVIRSARDKGFTFFDC
jgi:methylthioribose-1-phosphate isomerase